MSNSGNGAPKIVFRLGHLGDVVLTTGVLAKWNENHCEQYIFVTRKGNAAVLNNHPAIIEVIELEPHELQGVAWAKRSRELADRFKKHTLLDLHGTLRSRILSFFWKGPVKRYPKFGLTRRLYDLTHRDRFRHILETTNVTQRYWMAQESTPPEAVELIPRIYLTANETERGTLRLSSITNGKPVVAIHPYATHPAKQWPRDHWKELTAQLAGNGYDWFVIGRDQTPLFVDHVRDMTNATDLRETCALLKQADLLVTGDSGPMHMACGVGTPVLALFGPTARAWGFYPAGPEDLVLEIHLKCRPCSLHGSKNCDRGFHCMSGTTPERVLKAINDRLKP